MGGRRAQSPELTVIPLAAGHACDNTRKDRDPADGQVLLWSAMDGSTASLKSP